MLKMAHIGLTVSNLENSLKFYRDILGLEEAGSLTMQGENTYTLFGKVTNAKVAYLKAEEGILLELIEFSKSISTREASLFRTSISELCFYTDDIEREYARLSKLGVEFLSSPQEFDFTADGFGKSKAVYFKDPDGIILEYMQELKEAL